MPRPERLVLVVGTGTEVGKTWVACALARALLAAGVVVAARKPAQSFDPAAGVDGAGAHGRLPTDAELLAAATGEAVGDVCPPGRTYPLAMAPPMAAAALGRPVPTLAELVGGLADGSGWDLRRSSRSPDPESTSTVGAGIGVGIVETAGGVRSPLAEDGDSVDAARALHPDLVLLVADAGLGTINAVRSSAQAVAEWPLAVLLNRYDAGSDLHRRNRAWLAERDRLPVYTDVAEVVALLGPAVRPEPDPARPAPATPGSSR